VLNIRSSIVSKFEVNEDFMKIGSRSPVYSFWLWNFCKIYYVNDTL